MRYLNYCLHLAILSENQGCNRQYQIILGRCFKNDKRRICSYHLPKNKNDNEELQPRPDCEMMYKELQKPGVTRTLLWEEYAREVKAAGKIPLQYSQFCNYFNHYLEINKATMHFEHKIAERIEVDWCGTTIPIVNELTGEVTKGYLFDWYITLQSVFIC